MYTSLKSQVKITILKRCRNLLTIGPDDWDQFWFQKATTHEPADTGAVICIAPDVPSSLHAIVDDIGSVIGFLLKFS